MSWLERQISESEKRIAARKEYQEWLGKNPEIKQRVDQLNDESLDHLKKAGVASTVAFAGALFTPASFLFMGEYGRQMLKAGKKLKERNQVIRDNSPYRRVKLGE